MKTRYFLKMEDISDSEKEVTEEQWKRAERKAGFYPKGGGNECATGGFGGHGISGRIEFVDTK